MTFNEAAIDLHPAEVELPQAERFFNALKVLQTAQEQHLDADFNFRPEVDEATRTMIQTAYDALFDYCVEFPTVLPSVLKHLQTVLLPADIEACIRETIPAARHLPWGEQRRLSHDSLHAVTLGEDVSGSLAWAFESQAREATQQRVLECLPTITFDSWSALEQWVGEQLAAEGAVGYSVVDMQSSVLRSYGFQLEQKLPHDLLALVNAYQSYPADFPVRAVIVERSRGLLHRTIEQFYEFNSYTLRDQQLTVWRKEKQFWQDTLLPEAVDLYVALLVDPKLSVEVEQSGKWHARWTESDYHQVLEITHNRKATFAMAQLPMERLAPEDREAYRIDLYKAYAAHRPAELMRSLPEFVTQLSEQPAAERERLFLEHGTAANYPSARAALQRYVCAIGEVIPHTAAVYAQLFKEVCRTFLNAEEVFFAPEVMRALDLTPERRVELLQATYDQYWMQYPDSLLHKWIINPERVPLRPDQIATLTEKLRAVQSFHHTAVEEFYRFPGTAEQNVALAEALLCSQAPLTPLFLETLVGIYPGVCERVIQHTGELPPERFTQIVRTMLAGYLYSFEENPAEAQRLNRHNRDLILAVLDTLSPELQSQIKPLILAHAVDPDFADVDQAQRLATSWELPIPRQAALPNKERFTAVLMERITAAAPTNIEYLSRSYQEQLPYIKELQERSFVTINCSAEALAGILKNQGRLKATWDIPQRERFPSRFVNYRHVVEARLGIRGRGTEAAPHPIYGALAYEQGIHDQFGAAPDYGDCWLRLRPEVVEQRTSFTSSDTYNSSNDRSLVTAAEVGYLIADRIKHNSGGSYSYIEAQIHGGVSLEDIAEIHIPRKDQAIHQTTLDAISAQYPHIRIVIEAVSASERKTS